MFVEGGRGLVEVRGFGIFKWTDIKILMKWRVLGDGLNLNIR